jgi:hypothetical protein
MIAPGVAGARAAVGARTILPRPLTVGAFVAITRDTRTLRAGPGIAPVIARLAGERPVSARPVGAWPIIAIELAPRRTIAVAFEITAGGTVAVLAERAALRIAARPSLGALLATASILARLEVALRTIVAIELAPRRPVTVLAERSARRIAARRSLASASIFARLEVTFRTIVAVELAARRAVTVTLEGTLRPIALFAK